jgi:opacity protein-like surface antigen
MRRFVIAGLAVAFFVAASTAFASDGAKASFKIGGGALYNAKADNGKSLGGGHFAIDFNVPGKQVALSPFVDYFNRSDRKTVLGGLDLLIRPRMNSNRASVYFGIGGGLAHLKYSATVMQSQTQTVVDSTGASTEVTTTVPVSVSRRPNKALINVLAGVELRASEKVSFFIEPRYVWAGSRTLNGLTGQVGLAFHVK